MRPCIIRQSARLSNMRVRAGLVPCCRVLAMTPDVQIISVAVAAPLEGEFHYVPPAGMTAEACPVGARVRVPFGAGERLGIVLGRQDGSSLPLDELKPIASLLDEDALLAPTDIRLGEWLARYYHAPLGEVLAQMLPVALRDGGGMDLPVPQGWVVDDAAPHAASRSRLQTALLERFRSSGGMLSDADLSGHAATLRAMRDKGWVRRIALPQGGGGVADALVPSGVSLNEEQQAACSMILSGREAFSAFLLHGITGSGKTEVYLALMDDVIARGGQVLVLVPEISLTPQLVERFSSRLPGGVVVLHSGMTDNARREAWIRSWKGQARVIIGTRSAVFTPMPRLALIVVDEEHDGSYKQQEGMRYHARDVAVVRAMQRGIPIVLGSATPSLESLFNVEQGRYRLLRLKKRAAGARLPRMEVLDVRRRPMHEGLSAPLIERMRDHLVAGGQVLLFLNRRGFAPALLCHACGGHESCRQCSAPMTVHRSRHRLVCHHCGAERPLPRHCSACGSSELDMPGQGTERLEMVIQGLFPEFPFERIDRDTTRRKGALEAKLARARAGEARILLGTQMLAKGHDFPGVTLAVVLDADRGLFSNDFRAPERLVQLIVQVAGRAGRAERPGEVLIQTHQPEHPLLQALLRGGFDACAKALMHERRLANLPPFSHLAMLRAEARDAARSLAMLERCGEWIASMPADVHVYGPVPAPLERRAGRFRHQLMLSSRRREALHLLLDRLLPAVRSWPESRGVRWSLDVDPQDMG